MLFNSVNFLLFFPICVVIYYLLSSTNTLQKVFLLFASYYFYANFEPRYLLLLLFITLISYGAGLLLEKIRINNKRKRCLVVTCVTILAPLFFFKYFNFFNQIIFDILSSLHLRFEVSFLRILLPVGISFYTFQALSYVIDIYQCKIKVERSFLNYALFLGFFPQIASGPIGRASSLLPQIKQNRIFNYDNLSKGFNYLIWGYFLKLVIADRGAVYVNTVFENYVNHSGLSLILATIIYSIQIYGDFAGYSLMALGTAKMMGFDLINNFKRPYLATSVTEFWRRWHISLSTWFRDYVYIPLGGNRVSAKRHNINILITFFISGIWHGAAYNFIIWGILHGIYQIIGKYTGHWQDKFLKRLKIYKESKLYRFINIAITFILVSYAWLIFRINNIEDIIQISKRFFTAGSLYIHITTLAYLGLGLFIWGVKSFLEEYYPSVQCLTESKHILVRQISLIVVIVIILSFGVLNSGQFIYFAF